MSANEFVLSVSVAKLPNPTMPTDTTATNVTRAAIQRATMDETSSGVRAVSAVWDADGAAEARDELGLHPLGIDGDDDPRRRPIRVFGPVQAAGQVRVGARVAGQRLAHR